MTDETPATYTRHNHITRDTKPAGQCPACDYYHARQAPKLLERPVTPFNLIKGQWFLGTDPLPNQGELDLANLKLRKIRALVTGRERDAQESLARMHGGEPFPGMVGTKEILEILDAPPPASLDPEWVRRNVPRPS